MSTASAITAPPSRCPCGDADGGQDSRRVPVALLIHSPTSGRSRVVFQIFAFRYRGLSGVGVHTTDLKGGITFWQLRSWGGYDALSPDFLICTAHDIVSTVRVRRKLRCHALLAILPAVVQLVIMLVNGKSAGVAVAGVWGFRSRRATAKEIGLVPAMAIGLATGMGYVWLAVMAFVIVSAAMLLLTAVNFGGADEHERVLRITIPESLDYDGLFDDLFEKKYTKSCVLERVKTSNMGTLYELTYRVTLP